MATFKVFTSGMPSPYSDKIVLECEAPQEEHLNLLYPEEAALIEHSTSTLRRMLFSTGRIVARRACEQVAPGSGKHPLLRGDSNQPLFPAGIHGSISHCDQLACAIATTEKSILGVGVDIELRNRSLSPRVIERITSPNEKECYKSLGVDEKGLWIKIFCAKEAIFKAAFPFILRDFTFADLDILFSSESEALVHTSPRLESRLNECCSKWKLTLDFRDIKQTIAAIAIVHTRTN